MRYAVGVCLIVLAALGAIGIVQAQLRTADQTSNAPPPGTDGPILPNPYMPTGFAGTTWSLLEGDFNEDGLVDLAAVGDPGLLILLGQGDGTFSQTRYSGRDYWAGKGSIADFNEDGHQDIVFGRGLGAAALLGIGDGTFGAPIHLQASYPPLVLGFGVAVGDFDNDDHEDVVAGGLDDSSAMAFFAGNGDGTFAEAVVTSDTGRAHGGLGAGDFNEDGNLDFVGTAVWLGSGDGSFSSRSWVGGDRSLEIFDFDGDTHLDVAYTVYEYDDPHGVRIRLGNGDGTFSEATTYRVGTRAKALLVRDVDGDGKEDLLVSHGRLLAISVLPGNGDGTFDPMTKLATASVLEQMAIADFDDDGYDDLAGISYWGQFLFMPGDTDGIPGADPATVRTTDPMGYADAATFGDVNGDGLQDVVRALDYPEEKITVMLADGDGGFDLSASFDGASAWFNDVAIADLDGDSNADVVVTNADSQDALILLGSGDGTFAPPFAFPLAVEEPVSIVTGRFDSDPHVDLAVSTGLGGAGSPNEVHVFRGRGNASFRRAGSYPVGRGPRQMEAGDFNEDGEIDLVTSNSFSDDLSLLIGVGNGKFRPEVRYPASFHSSMSVGDVNGDGHEDILLAGTYDVVSDRYDNDVMYGAGDGTFAAPVDLLPDPDPTDILRVGDLNGDGLVDLVGEDGAGISLRLGHGGGTFGEPSFFVSPGALEITLADANGDGLLDVLVTGGREIATLLNICDECDGK